MIITPDQARIFSQGLGQARILVDGERSGGTWWLGQFREDPGFMTSGTFILKQPSIFSCWAACFQFSWMESGASWKLERLRKFLAERLMHRAIQAEKL